MVGIGLDHRAQPRRLQELLLRLGDMQLDAGAAGQILRLADGVAAGAFGFPAPALRIAGAGDEGRRDARGKR